MVKTPFITLLIILLLSMSSVAQQQDGSVFERRVTINQKNQSLGYILEQISWQASVFFSYDASIIDTEKKLSVAVTNKSLFTVLNQLFRADNFKFSELQNQVIISRAEEVIQDTIVSKYFFLTGKIVDQKKGNPVQFATISVLNKPLGTISNSDGEFLLKIHPDNILDTIQISCMGFSPIKTPAHHILDEDIFVMNPISVHIKEIRVTSSTPEQILKNIHKNWDLNYSRDPKLLTAFYRETVKQDENYINVSEAIMEILKGAYTPNAKNDVVRLIKGRKSPDVQPFQWINFKLQGGPFTITQLDVAKSLQQFVSEDSQHLYSYTLNRSIWYKNHPVYVLKFEPNSKEALPEFVGEMYVHRETFAIVHVKFRLNKNGLKDAAITMIKKKPKGVKARPSFVHYTVNYQKYQGKWHLATAQANVKFKIRSKRDRINSEFHSVSDILVTDIQPTQLKRFKRLESISRKDIFVEMINDYDEQFWENFNIIKPNDDLRNAFKHAVKENN